jgi:hypothetical protein
VGLADASITLVSTKSGKEIAGFWAMPSETEGRRADNWIVYAPQGENEYYDASPGAATRIRWWQGTQVFAAEKHEKRFFRPDIVQQTLAAVGEGTSLTSTK